MQREGGVRCLVGEGPERVDARVDQRMDTRAVGGRREILEKIAGVLARRAALIAYRRAGGPA